jgi:hypothetical protein
LKKRSKKLLPVAAGILPNRATRLLAETDKSFFVSFFQKRTASLPSFATSAPINLGRKQHADGTNRARAGGCFAVGPHPDA